MSSAERVKLLDAAMRSREPDAYLDAVHVAFDEAGRPDDGLTAMVIRALIRTGEIEMLMHMRAEWRGGDASVRSRPSWSA